MDQKDILTRISYGDEIAFNILYKRFRPCIYTFLVNYVHHADLAEDLCQELFLKIWYKRESLSDIQCFSAYLHTMARNLAINSLKKTALSVDAIRELIRYYPSHDSDSTYHEIQHNEYNRMLTIELNKLPERSREIFTMCRDEGKTYAEVAKKMGISRNAIKNHMVSTLKSLKTFAEKRFGVTISVALFSFSALFC